MEKYFHESCLFIGGQTRKSKDVWTMCKDLHLKQADVVALPEVCIPHSCQLTNQVNKSDS